MEPESLQKVMILEVFLINDNKTLISKTIRLIFGIKSSQLKKLFSCQDSFDQRKSPWEKNCQGPCKEVEVEHHRFISGQRRENRDEVCVFRPLNQPRRTEDGPLPEWRLPPSTLWRPRRPWSRWPLDSATWDSAPIKNARVSEAHHTLQMGKLAPS